MKSIVEATSSHRIYAKAIEWGKLITITGGAQILIQGIALISGILVIRILPTQEYAFYTLANTMLGTMTVLADGGISTGVMAEGGKVWQQRDKLGSVLVTGLNLRKKFAIGSLIVATPLLLYLLRHHEASWLTSILLTASLIPAFYSTLSGTLFQIAPKLKQDILPLQKNQVGVNLGRLTLLSLTLFLFPWAFIAILAAGLPQIWGNVNLRKISMKYANWGQKIDLAVKKNILVVVKRMLPGAIYFCVSGQVTIWLISIYGSTTALAQIGALGRLAMVLSLLSVIFNVLLIPRFARLKQEKNKLFKWYVVLQTGAILVCAFIIGIAYKFSSEFLWILGNQYLGLNHELILQLVGSCLNLLVGLIFSLNSNRGWIMNPILGISIGLMGIIMGISLMDVSTLIGVLKFNIFTGVVGILAYSSYGFFRLLTIR